MADHAPKSSVPGSGALPSSSQGSLLPSLDRARLDAIVEPIVRAHGGEVVDVEFKSEQGGRVLRVYVEKAGAAASNLSTEAAAIDLELCTAVARELSPALDAVDLIPHRYCLEVSSPGVERPLRHERDFVRFAGKKAKVKLHTAVKGQRVLAGVLGPVENGSFSLLDGSHAYAIALDNVANARLVFEFGPRQAKPGHSRKKQT
jgi:ribosome maturation factor RimP